MTDRPSDPTDGPDDADPDPWAPGGAMSDAWFRPTGRIGPTSGDGDRAPDEHPADDHPDGEHIDDKWLDAARHRRTARQRRTIIVVAFVAVLALAAGSVATFGNDGATPADNPPEPPVPTSSPIAPNRDVLPPTSDGIGGSVEAVGANGAGAGLIAEPPTMLRPPPSLPLNEPMEIVVTTANGVSSIALPSGRTRSVAAAADVGPLRITVSDQGVVAWPASLRRGIVLIGDDGSIRTVRTPAIAQVSSLPDGFVLWPDPTEGDLGVPILLQPDAVVAPLLLAGDVPAGAPTDSTGSFLVDDAGGLYRVEARSQRRVSTGELIATGRAHALVRECDDERRCELVLIDGFDARSPIGRDLPARVAPLGLRALSPTGTAMLVELTGNADRGAHVLDLITGGLLALPSDDRPTSTIASADAAEFAWTIDGSGVIVGGTELRYVHLASGEVISLSASITDVRTVDVRAMSRTPFCDLVDIVLPTLIDIRSANDTTIDPPSRSMLDALLDVAPDELREPVAPLVRFAGSFVSRDQPESLRFENWPDDVRAGVATLERHADEACS